MITALGVSDTLDLFVRILLIACAIFVLYLVVVRETYLEDGFFHDWFEARKRKERQQAEDKDIVTPARLQGILEKEKRNRKELVDRKGRALVNRAARDAAKYGLCNFEVLWREESHFGVAEWEEFITWCSEKLPEKGYKVQSVYESEHQKFPTKVKISW